jgi:hypothetical protein
MERNGFLWCVLVCGFFLACLFGAVLLFGFLLVGLAFELMALSV